MKTLIWITIAAMMYTTPMTVDYTADGFTILIDNQGYEWEYGEEIEAEEVTVLLWNNGTPEIEDDIILDIQSLIEL